MNQSETMSIVPVRRQVRVLVVDDDPQASQAIRGLLNDITEFECIPELVSDFDAGIEHFNARAIDVCLLDDRLGGRDGVALLKHAANIGVRFPILFLSDERSVNAVVATMQAGAANYLLRKDLSVETLTRAIASAAPTERRVNPARPSDFLVEGDQLFEYRIVKVLGHGGFGITYLARDTLLNTDVAIKEYLPSDLAFRATHTHVAVRTPGDQDAFQWGLKQFLKEAQTLARFAHPNLVRVRRFFEANATAYFVMEYALGEPFSAVLKRENTLPEERIRAVLDPLLDALEGVHAAGILHRDIKPDNILLLADGRPLLIDFGAARVQLGKTQSFLSMYSAGYAPIEQYSSDGAEQGAWTDIYALGGLVYRCITGHRPDDSVDRVRNDTMGPASQLGKGRYSEAFLAAVDWALSVHADDRPRSVAEWRNGFTGRVRFADTSEVTRKSPRTLALGASKALAWGAGALVAVLAVGAALKYTIGKPDAPAPVEQAPVTATLPPAPADKVATKPSGPKALAAMEAMSVFRDCPNCPEMVVIPAGGFLMGSSGKDANPTEQPAHPVVLDKPFAIGRFEVTVGEWAECVREKACSARNAGLAGRLPASRVNWREAQRYAAWLAARTGRDYRLPSEAAWEYAARSGITTGTFWGDKPELQCRYANGADDAAETRWGDKVADCDDGQARLALVGRFRPNFYDLYDMLGNVSEWTMDCWLGSYVGAPADGSAMTVGACAKRVARGGSWKSPPDAVQATSREAYDADYQGDNVGFRVVAN